MLDNTGEILLCWWVRRKNHHAAATGPVVGTFKPRFFDVVFLGNSTATGPTFLVRKTILMKITKSRFDELQEQFKNFRFQGNWARPALFQLVAYDVLKVSEAWLLMLISNFHEHGNAPDSNIGCFASNKTLGFLTGLSKIRIVHILVKLRKLGFIKTTKSTTYKRYMVVCWDKINNKLLDVETEFKTKKPKMGSGPPRPLGVVIHDHYNIQHYNNTTYCHNVSNRKSNRVVTSPTEKSTNSSGVNGLGNGSFHTELNGHAKYQRRHYALASKLYHTLEENNLLLRGSKPKITKWAEMLYGLEKSTSRDRVRSAINWYRKHITDKYVPRVWAAKTFKQKFIQIESAMQRHAENELPAKITKEARRVIKYMNINWPKGFDEHLPGIVQKSLDNAAKFISALKKADKLLYHHLRDQCLLDKIIFVRYWLEEGYKQVANWDQWSGEPKTLLFSVNNKRFKRMFLGWATECHGYSGAGNKALELISNGST